MVEPNYSRGKTEYVFITGKLKWVRNERLNQWDKWSITVYPTPADLEKIRELQAEGLKNIIKKDDDGYYTTFSRPHTKEFKNKITTFGPPEVLDKDGQPLNVSVGNGSDGVVKLEVYPHGTPGGGKAKAARWLALRVDTLVPFDVEKDYVKDSDEEKHVRGLMSQPEQLF